MDPLAGVESTAMDFLRQVLLESWGLLRDSGIYVLFGILVGGLLKVFLSPESVARHLGRGRVLPVLKAAFFGIPLPLCSCGVLPAAASLKKQGANNGAVSAFLISTPESGVDSMAGQWISRSSRSRSPPRLIRALWRADSTRIRRMASAAAEKKCPRESQC